MSQALIDYIKQLIHLDEEEAKLVDSLFLARSYRKGTYFLKEGSICNEIGFLTAGLVAYCIEEEQSTHIYHFGFENNFVCNYESFLTKTPSSKSIRCAEDVEMLCISYQNLQVLYHRVAEGQKMGRIISEQLFLQAIADITSFYVDSPQQRYQKLLADYPELSQRIPQYLIASYLKVQPQSLSRIRKRILKNKDLY